MAVVLESFLDYSKTQTSSFLAAGCSSNVSAQICQPRDAKSLKNNGGSSLSISSTFAASTSIDYARCSFNFQ